MHQQISIVIFTSFPIGEQYLKTFHESLTVGMTIGHVVICRDSRNPYFGGEAKDPITEFCSEKNISFSESPEKLFGQKFTLGISFGNYFILKKEHLACFEKGVFNFHGADIKKYKGSAAPVFHILEDDKKEFGYAYHQINERLDEGDILMEKSFTYPANYTSRQINLEVVRRSIEDLTLFIKQINEFISGKNVLSPNNSNARTRKRNELFGMEETKLEIELPAAEKYLRAFDWPEIFKHPMIKINDQKVRLVPESTYEEIIKVYREFKYQSKP